MLTISLIDTSLGTDNLGDEIIMDAVEKVVYALFPDAYYYRVPSHDLISDRTRRFVKRSDYTFIGGTNLLSSRMSTKSQWRVSWLSTLWMNRAICLGVGWNDYSHGATFASRLLLRRLLDGETMHSARDAYSLSRIAELGVDVVNTACPTMWGLTDFHCEGIPREKSEDVVFTLTCWRTNIEADRALIRLLKSRYRRVHFFSQQREDYDYLQRFDISGIRIITPTTKGYTHFLENEEVDYVGTRLHGGIRALQQGRRTLILGVDNRGLEIHRDTGLPVIPRDKLADIEGWIDGTAATTVRLPWAAINQWRRQFGIESHDMVASPAPAI
jgi:polysaccharide pyruvyl transferase WcaK-like protein